MIVATVSLAAALVVCRPLPAEITRGLPVGARQLAELPVLTRIAADTLQLYYQLWLVQDGLVGPTPLFTDPYQFRVDGPRWNLPQTFLPLALPFTALSPFGLHAAYNLLVLLSFPAAGLAAYGLARHLTRDAAAASVAGIGFALLPARLDPLFGGHPAGFAMALVPAVLWGLDVALTEGRFAGGLGGGLAFVALAMLEPQYTYLAAGLALAHAGMRLPFRSWRRLRLGPLVAFGLLALAAFAWVFMLRQAFVAGSIAEAGRRLNEVKPVLPRARRPRRAGALRRARARPAGRRRARGPGAPETRRAPDPLRGRAGRGGPLERGPHDPAVPALPGLPPLDPLLRDDPESREAPGPDERRRHRAGGARRPGDPGPDRFRRRVPARGDGGRPPRPRPPRDAPLARHRLRPLRRQPRLRDPASRGVTRPLPSGLARGQRALGPLPLRGHADARPDAQRLLTPRAAAVRPGRLRTASGLERRRSRARGGGGAPAARGLPRPRRPRGLSPAGLTVPVGVHDPRTPGLARSRPPRPRRSRSGSSG